MSDTVENKELQTEDSVAEEKKQTEDSVTEEGKQTEDSVTKEEKQPEEGKQSEEAEQPEEEKKLDVSKETVVTAEAEPYVVAVPVGERKKVPIWAKICMITVSVAAVVYLAGVAYFSTHFLWNTTLNGVDVSFLSASQAQYAIEKVIDDYQLEIQTRGGETEIIKGKDIDLDFQLSGTVEQTIQKQNVWLWFIDGWLENANIMEASVTYDIGKLNSQIRALDCLQSNNIVMPVEPQLVKKGNEYVVVEGDAGKKPLEYKVRKVIKESISNLMVSVDLDEAGCYAELEYDVDDKAVQDALEYLNTIQDMKITYEFQGGEEVLKGSEILKWVEISKDYEISMNDDDVREFIEQLKEDYEIRGQAIIFHTSYDETVEITSYIRSNELNTDVEVEELLAAVDTAMKSGKREFVRGSDDMASVGDTYIEINLTAQHLYCYKDGIMIFDTDIVSGRPSTGCATPPGVYSIRAKSSPAILVGATYRQPVSYWMPFNGGIGLHDATWQSAYGGQRYLSNGSHGCINLPLDAAKFIYEHYSAGDYVVLYHLTGTEQAEATPAARPESSPIYVPVPPADTTEAPATETPATETPATEAPTTEAPATEPPTTEPTTEATTETTTEPIPEPSVEP